MNSSTHTSSDPTVPSNRAFLYKITAEQILEIRSAHKLFVRDELKTQRRILAQRFHPDKAEPAEKVKNEEAFQRIASLYEEAEKMLEAGLWGPFTTFSFDTSPGNQVEITAYRRDPSNQFGPEMLVGKASVYYRFPKVEDFTVVLAEKNLKAFQAAATSKFATKNDFHTIVQAGQLRILPSRTSSPPSPPTSENSFLRFPLDPEMFNLEHLVEKTGPLLPEHAAWLTSRLLNWACAMQATGIYAPGVSPRGVFLNPKDHYAAVLDGWQYYDTEKKELVAASPWMKALVPSLSKKTQVESLLLVGIQAVVRYALGDISGTSLHKKGIPAEFVKWLNTPLPSSFTPIAALNSWGDVKRKSFPVGKFEIWPHTASLRTQIFGD